SGGRARRRADPHRRASPQLAAARPVAAARRPDRPAGAAGRAALGAVQRTRLVGQPPSTDAGRRAALQGTGRRLRAGPGRHCHHFSFRKDAPMNKTFPAVSLLAVVAACVQLTACSDPPAPATAVKPVFVTTVTQAAAAQTRSFTSVVR